MRAYFILRRVFLALAVYSICGMTFAQVGINTDNSQPNASAMLDIKSTDKGVLIPRLTTDQINGISSPATGLLVYNSDDQNFMYFNGTTWREIHTDNQVLQLVGDTLYITNGNHIVLPNARLSTQNGLYSLDTCVYMEALDYEFTREGTPLTTWKITSLWQSFTTLSSGSLTGLDVSSNNYYGSFSGGVFRVYEGRGTGGTLLYETAIGALPPGWNHIDIPVGAVVVEKDAEYTFFLQSNSYFSFDYEEGYAGGTSSLDDGYDEDFVFRSYISTCKDTYIIGPGTANGTANLHNLDTIFFADGTLQTTTGTQILSKSGSTLNLSPGGGTVTLNDDNAQNELIQSVFFRNDSLFITDNGGTFGLDLRIGAINSEGLKISNCLNGEFIDQSQEISNSTTNNSVGSIWQSFTPSVTGEFSRVAYDRYINWQEYVTATIKVFEGEGISGNLIDMVTLQYQQFNGWNEFDLSSRRILLQKDSVYTFQISVSKPMYARFRTVNVYAGGRADNGVNQDYAFRVYLDTCNNYQNLVLPTSNGVNLFSLDTLWFADGTFQTTAFSDSSLSFQNTNNQTLRLDGTLLSISDGNSVDLSRFELPVGTIQLYAGSSAPDGWLICDGSTFSIDAYPELNAILRGNNLPSFSNGFQMGVADRETPHLLTSTRSEQTNTLTVSDGDVRNNMPPFFTVNFIIKAK